MAVCVYLRFFYFLLPQKRKIGKNGRTEQQHQHYARVWESVGLGAERVLSAIQCDKVGGIQLRNCI